VIAVITGLGAVSALGRGVGRLWSAMSEGWDGIAPIRRFDPSGFGVPLAGMVPDRNAPAAAAEAAWRYGVEFAVDAAREAWAHARLAGVAAERIALVLGSSLGDPAVPIHRMTEAVGDALGIAGPRLTVSTACTSSTNAIGIALDLLALGAADVVVAGGADVLTPLVLAGFHALDVLSHDKCAPFSEPPGTTLGEGAGFLVVERAEAAARRGVPAGRALCGYGLSADAFHDTGPDPTGAGVARAMRGALEHAGLAPDEVDYVNAHGTGTRANDPAEWRAIQHVFGPRARALPVSSSKSFLAHGQGAAGVLELLATLVAMDRGAIPPTQRFTVPRPHSPPDPVAGPTARPAACRVALSSNSAFGGANCAVVVGSAERTAPAIVRRPVYVAGVGAVGPHGVSLERARARARGRVPAFRLDEVLPSADPRGLDPTTTYVTAAAALALADGGVKLRGEARDRSGLVVGVTVASPQSERALLASIDAHGYRGLSATLFSRMVLNAPAGTCTKLLGLRGLHSTVAAAGATGLFAFLYAAELLAARRDADRMIAVGVDELPPGEAPEGASEGAAGALLAVAPGPVRVAGWSVAGPGRIAEAVAAAFAMARRAPGVDMGADADVDVAIGPAAPGLRAARRIDPADLAGDSAAYGTSLAVAVAAQMIRAGEARHVLVAQPGGGSADCAVVLTRGEEHHAS
jgi:3-oxoacyl-[acyl-carrier-protein] synthase II